MDWKDVLAQKVEKGELTREDFCEEEVSQKKALPVVNVILDSKGRKGKIATIVSGFECDDNELKKIASDIKSKLSTGGSARGGEILLQGDRRKEVSEFLKGLGYRVKC